MTAGGDVLTSVDGAVGHITLNRPEVRNAITAELGLLLEQALTTLAADAAVRVILVRGAGGHFCAGGDFGEVQRLRPGGPDALRPLFENFGRACAVIASLDVPVVAAVEGHAMAGGFELLQACDIVLARDDATLADNHANFGQVPGGGSSQRLARIVGRPRALGHILSGERLTGAEAARWGLVYRSFPPEDFEASVAAFVTRLAGQDRAAQAKIKRLVYTGLGTSLEQGLALELATVVEHIAGDAGARGVAAFAARGTSS